MFAAFQDIVNALSGHISPEEHHDNNNNNLDVDDEFADQDRILQEHCTKSRKSRENGDPSLEALFAGVREDAKGAHAERTRDSYKS